MVLQTALEHSETRSAPDFGQRLAPGGVDEAVTSDAHYIDSLCERLAGGGEERAQLHFRGELGELDGARLHQDVALQVGGGSEGVGL